MIVVRGILAWIDDLNNRRESDFPAVDGTRIACVVAGIFTPELEGPD